MVFGIGCDIVEHELTAKLGWVEKPELIRRIFDRSEIGQMTSDVTIKFLSGRFAAKEAVLKAIGVVMEDGISLLEIIIYSSDNGAPQVRLEGKIKQVVEQLKITSIAVTISHSEKFSIAFAVAEITE